LGQFSYRAVNRAGVHISGMIEAPDHRSAVAVLADKGQFVVEVKQASEAGVAGGAEKALLELAKVFKFGSRRISSKDILAITNQLSAALRAGLPLLDALKVIRDQQQKVGMRNLLDELVRSVSGGQSLSEALAAHEQVFSPLYISMVRVGETGGMLDQTTQQLSRILARDEKTKTSIKNASAYPVFVLCLGLVSAVIVISWVLPKVLRTIGGGVEMLPVPTRVLLGLGTFIKLYGWLVVIVLAAAGYFLRKWVKSEGRVKWDAFKLKVPVLGSVLRTISIGRFARTLGALTKGGVTILESLSVVRDTLGNELLAREIDEVAEKVKTGSALAAPLEASRLFPPLLVQIVSIGEHTGKLDELLLGAADTFDDAADAAVAKFMAIFPAVLILLLALVIGFIIAATLLPIVIMELGGGAL